MELLERLRTGRHYGLTMEPRSVMATWDAAAPIVTIYGAAKVPFFNRRILSAQIGLPVEQIEMIENEMAKLEKPDQDRCNSWV